LEDVVTYPLVPGIKYDVHTHTTLSPATFELLAKFSSYEGFIRVRARSDGGCGAQMIGSDGRVFRNITETAYDAAARLADMDRYRVTVQVISPTPAMIPDYVDTEDHAVEICRILNDDNASTVAKFPERFIALGALPMRFPSAAIKEMERIKALGMRGIEINSNIQGMDLDDPRLFDIFAAAAENNMAVFVHPWAGFMSPGDVALRARMNERLRWRPWLVGMPMETALAFDSMYGGRVHERLPNLRVLYAHGGGAFPALLGRLAHGRYCRPDLFPDAPKLNHYETILQAQVYTDALTHDPFALRMLVNELGSRRVAMGSDYPYPLGEIDPFDSKSLCDPQGNTCPYPERKGIYPGHMIEHLPTTVPERRLALAHFNWLARSNADGPRRLPLFKPFELDNMLFGAAKCWLGLDRP
jgi:aminocarboxymuconate-semialdehyde decarboxylase